VESQKVVIVAGKAGQIKRCSLNLTIQTTEDFCWRPNRPWLLKYKRVSILL
jgi:hypothetical protein